MNMRTQSLDYLLDSIRDAVCSIDESVQNELIDSILSAKTVFIYGSGRSGLVGQLFAVRLVQIGLDVHFVGDMTTPIISKGDTVILISNTGETMSAVQTANIARRLGADVICITSSRMSKLAHASNTVIELKNNADCNRKVMPLGTLFEDSVVIMLDSVIPILMERLGCSEEEMRKRHAIWV